MDNPASLCFPPHYVQTLEQSPLVAVGILDEHKRPWTTIWGGLPGVSQQIGESVIEIKSAIDWRYDPVVRTLFDRYGDGEAKRVEEYQRMVSALAINLENRSRVKFYGRIEECAVTFAGQGRQIENPVLKGRSEIRCVINIDQSIGNCPKYLNCKKIRPAAVSSSLAFDSPNLAAEAVNMVKCADLFFISSSNVEHDMDTNHRGGSPGFVRIQKVNDAEWELFWPEYSGNRFYMTLGNLQTTPVAGLVFPSFLTGNVLYLTGKTNILVGNDASAIMPRANVVVRVVITAARFVYSGLPFRGDVGDPSPYNPPLRPLASEPSVRVGAGNSQQTAKLLRKTPIAPTIFRYHFKISNSTTHWKAGQWIAFDFSKHFWNRYSLTRSQVDEKDPQSLNDDFVRTFTISSPPVPKLGKTSSDDEFEITVRNVGRVTQFLSWSKNDESLEIDIRGFGGEDVIEQEHSGISPCVACGIGITPILAQLRHLDWSRLKIWWTLRLVDVALVVDVLEQYPGVGHCLSIYLTGVTAKAELHHLNALQMIRKTGAACEMRRLLKEDLTGDNLSEKWYICVNTNLRLILEDWLHGKTIISDDFNF